MKDVALRGGDADANASVVCGLLGALYGITNISEVNIRCILNSRSDLDYINKRTQIRPKFLVPAYVFVPSALRIILNQPKDLEIIFRSQNYRGF